MSRRANGAAAAARLERLRDHLSEVIEHFEAGLHQAQVALVEVEAELHLTQRRAPLNSAAAAAPNRKEAAAE